MDSNISSLLKHGEAEVYPRSSRKGFLGRHSMVVLGYKLGGDGTISKLLVKNSWGTHRGENGYLVLDRKFIQDYLIDLFYKK